MNKKTLKVYILGASGFLGTRCAEYFRSKDYQVLDNRIDICDLEALRRFFQSVKPDVAINLTGPPANPNIDWCEIHKEETVKMLVAAPVNFVLASIEAGTYPIQLTSGCVYKGGLEYAFTEEDKPNFYGSFYSRMRIVGQDALAELPVIQTRIRMPLSSVPNPRNTITKIASYKKVISVPNSVTLVEDLWPAMERLIKLRPIGILNLTNEGYVEHSQLLKAYKKFVDPKHEYKAISLEELKTKAQRSNCVLSMVKAKSLGISMSALTEERVAAVMSRYSENLKDLSV